MQKKPAVALFGGSFDPPHLGHLEIVKKVLALKEVDKVLIVPTYLNPFKSKFAVEPKKRLLWVKEAFDMPGVEMSDFEIKQKRPVYTVETVKELGKKHNIKYIVIGADNLKSITKWKDFDYLNDNFIWIVATREGRELNPKFALADTSSALVIGNRGTEVKPRRTLRVRLRFPPAPLLPSTNASDASSNAKFGLNLEPLKQYILIDIQKDVSSSEIREGKKFDFLIEKIKPQVLLEYNLIGKD